ncbi:FeoA family protein [Pyrococcus yayanosii]|uniref:FeoA domain superfamily n=1 Tax=Pyrococcus yayanosii (strain CH1 / JCM 16557) TaxID=529709 RepID=F8AEA7_PYRYC|nr:FeoA domain-containing protein [Pyrococcus yayanosii]AEH24618.1 FeoA domain superfamily [Pyrococcus yayanosii CH1]
MLLTALREGEEGVVVDILGSPNVRARLIALGIAPGVRIRVIKAQGPGPMIIAVGALRVAIGWGIANKIVVRRV